MHSVKVHTLSVGETIEIFWGSGFMKPSIQQIR